MSDEADYLLTMAATQGVAVASVKDGHVLVFKRDHLRKLVEKSDQDTLIIFVKNKDDQDAS